MVFRYSTYMCFFTNVSEIQSKKFRFQTSEFPTFALIFCRACFSQSHIYQICVGLFCLLKWKRFYWRQTRSGIYNKFLSVPRFICHLKKLRKQLARIMAKAQGNSSSFILWSWKTFSTQPSLQNSSISCVSSQRRECATGHLHPRSLDFRQFSFVPFPNSLNFRHCLKYELKKIKTDLKVRISDNLWILLHTMY